MEIKERFSINVLVNGIGEILLLRRGKSTTLGPGLWGFSAGHIEPGESPRDCSLRELREEIGDNHEIELVNTIGPVRDTFYGGAFIIYLFQYRWHSGEIRLNHEHTDYAWVNRQHYKNYEVMDGIDEDLLYLNIWPRKYLNEGKLPSD